MPQRKQDDDRSDDSAIMDSNLIRTLVYIALTLSAGNGVYVASSASEVYTSADAAREARSVQIQIESLSMRIEDLKRRVDIVESTYPHPEVKIQVNDHEQRLRELERLSRQR